MSLTTRDDRRWSWYGALALAAPVTLAVACLPDLPAPLDCPPAPQISLGDCTEALVDAAPGCFPPQRMECLTGVRSTCDCISNECPGGDACYGDGGCPSQVLNEWGSSARCQPLSEGDIGIGQLPAVTQCVCGCYGCVAACDGYGPVLGSYSPPGVAAPVTYIRLSDDLPDRGRLGIYARTRGFGNLLLVTLRGQLGEQLTLGPVYFVPTPLGNDFSNDVYFNNGVALSPGTDGLAFEWDKPEDKPTLLLLTAALDNESDILSLVEIDCVVPFVVPLEEP